MEKNIEDLLKPRYRVIADYPMQFYSIGDILETANPQSCTVVEGEYWQCDLDKYPAIFRKLFWWEERIFVEDGFQGKYVKEFDLMPQFIKSKSTSNIYKVIWYSVDTMGVVSCLVETEKGSKFRALQDMDIATQSEYNSYIKQSTK